MGLLTKLGLTPTPAMMANAGRLGEDARRAAQGARSGAPAKAAPQKSPEMASLIGRFQEVMGRIKALEAQKAPGATALKLATIAAGNLSTSAKGIVAANAALDKVVRQLTDLKAKLDKATAATGVGKSGAPAHDGKKLADEARHRLKALDARGEKAIAANPRNPNAGWLAEVVANSRRALRRAREIRHRARDRQRQQAPRLARGQRRPLRSRCGRGSRGQGRRGGQGRPDRRRVVGRQGVARTPTRRRPKPCPADRVRRGCASG